MQHDTTYRGAASNGGRLASGTAAAACASALFLVSGCQPAPKVNAFADTAAQQATEARLRQAGADEALVPFDEKFYVAPPDSSTEVASAR